MRTVLLQKIHNNDKSCDEIVEVVIMIMIKEILIYLHNELIG